MKRIDQFTMTALLERAGCVLRGRNRADCIHCSGKSRGTVAYTNELAFCHRCHWKTNTRILARELGLLSDDPEARARFAAEDRVRKQRQRIAAQFEDWRNEHIDKLTTQHRERFHESGLAIAVLREFPDCDAAWQTLADYYDAESRLLRGFDFLMCAKASPWLEQDAKVTDVFAAWQQRQKVTA
jgi:hypothetical protein